MSTPRVKLDGIHGGVAEGHELIKRSTLEAEREKQNSMMD
jgi:hypothetical protein